MERVRSVCSPTKAEVSRNLPTGACRGVRRTGALGHSLIEVLVAALVMATGVLGASALQTAGLGANRIALQRSDAVQLSWSIIDRIRVNARGDYSVALGDPPPAFTDCLARPCSADDLATFDVVVWKCSLGNWTQADACHAARNAGAIPPLELQPGLPAGDGSIDYNGAEVTLALRWLPDRGDPLTLRVSSRS